MADERAWFGHVWWLTLHFRGSLYRLGRVQFAREEDALGVHIPRDGGPLTPEACDASFGRAHGFFELHFPSASRSTGRCTSWLLDPQLSAYLGVDSNICRFARRFTLSEELLEGDADVLRFVIGDVHQSLDQPPLSTTLERAVVEHLQSGKHWHNRCGSLRLPVA